ncbi:NUMOD4 motif-containing HNH endonuclease [Vallitaleaceae bacterium 9-2]
MWKDIKGYEGKYQASKDGQIRRIYKTREPRIMIQEIKNGKALVRLSDQSGRKEFRVHRLIYETFKGTIPAGYSVRHVNLVKSENALWNLQLISAQELGRETGHKSRQKAVLKIDKKGEVVKIYRSARQCAKDNYVSYQTICDRCNFKGIKHSLFIGGYAYCWDDDKKIRKFMNILKGVINGKN